MAMLQGMKELERVQRDGEGHSFPDVGEERFVRIPASNNCLSCPKYAGHGEPARAMGCKMLFGDQRQDLILESKRIDSDYLRDLQSYFFKLGYACNGYPGLEFVYNLGAGTANNIVQSTSYEIVSVDSNEPRRLKLRGRDPRAIGFSISTTNPDWLPLPPEQQTEPRLLSIPASNRLPVGSSVLFEYPSCLFGRLNPYIEEVEPPSSSLPIDHEAEDVEFWVKLSHSAAYARKPWDLAFPPKDGKYHCRIYSYLVSPEGWDNWQPSGPEAQYALRTREYLPADISEDSIELLDSDGGSTRVLLYGDAIKAVLEYTDGSSKFVPTPWDRLGTVDKTINDWESKFDLEGLDLEGLEKIVITYWPEAKDGDETIINARGRCRYSRHVIDGYGDGSGFICANTDCDKYRAGNFGGSTCWDTEASEFDPHPDDDADAIYALHSKFWQAEPLVLSQGATGAQIGSAASSHRNFAFDRKGGRVPSLGSICGGFFSGSLIPISRASTESWFGPRIGARIEYTDAQDRPWHRVSYGLFENKDATGPPVSAVDGWDDRLTPRGTAAQAETDRVYPLHRGPSCSVANFSMGPDPTPHIRLARPGDQETLFATGMPRDLVDNNTNARVWEQLT